MLDFVFTLALSKLFNILDAIFKSELELADLFRQLTRSFVFFKQLRPEALYFRRIITALDQPELVL